MKRRVPQRLRPGAAATLEPSTPLERAGALEGERAVGPLPNGPAAPLELSTRRERPGAVALEREGAVELPSNGPTAPLELSTPLERLGAVALERAGAVGPPSNGATAPLERGAFGSPSNGPAAPLERGSTALPEGAPRAASSPPRVPASSAQTRLLLLQALAPGDATYVAASIVVLRGPLDTERLRDALEWVVERHEALRTRFPQVDGIFVQEVSPPGPLALPELRVHNEAEARAAAQAHARRPLDPARDPLLAPLLLALAPDHHWLVLAMHHVITDRWSRENLLRELAYFYAPSPAFAAPPRLAIQYPDFALWQAAWLDSDAARRQLAHWRRALEHAPPPVGPGAPRGDARSPGTIPPTARPRPSPQALRAGDGSSAPAGPGPSFVVERQSGLGVELRGFARRRRVTPYACVLAAWALVLHGRTGARDLIVGCPAAARSHTDLEPLIGCFVNILPLRVRLTPGATHVALVRALAATSAEAFDAQDYPFDKLVEALAPPRAPGETPYFRTVLAYQSTVGPPPRFADMQVELRDVDTGTAKFETTVSVQSTGDVLELAMEVDTSRVPPPVARALMDELLAALEAILRRPEGRVGLAAEDELFAFEEAPS